MSTNHNTDPTAPDGRLLIDGREAAKLLSISPRKLQQLVAARAIPFIRVGRLVRFAPESLRQWVRKYQAQPVEPNQP